MAISLKITEQDVSDTATGPRAINLHDWERALFGFLFLPSAPKIKQLQVGGWQRNSQTRELDIVTERPAKQ